MSVTIGRLENTPIKEDEEKRKLQYALLLAWITDSPTATIEGAADTTRFAGKNNELLVLFMAGWTTYALPNHHSKDLTQGTTAGIRSAVNVYQGGGQKKTRKCRS